MLKEFVKILKKGKYTYKDLEEEFGLSRSSIRRRLNNISKEYNVLEETVGKSGKKIFHIPEEPDRLNKTHLITPKDHYDIALTGDWHIGSDATNYDDIKRYLEDANEKDVDVILHTGDLYDGFNVYRGQTQELFAGELDGNFYNCTSIDGQKELFTKFIELPTNMKVISGNHEYKSVRKGGHNPLKETSKYIDKLEYLGEFNETIDFNGVDVELIHPRGSKPYSKSYRGQTLLRERSPNNFPDIFAIGHTHDSGYFLAQGSHIVMTGTFLGQNNLSKRYGMDTIPNGYFVSFDVDESELKNIIIEHKRYK